MTITFRAAVRENVNLIIGLAGGTGSGKTYTAMELATGIAGDRRFAVIDTEAGRAKHYADEFAFDHADIVAPFTPDTYFEALKVADDAGYPVIVIDSMSHEHAGDGGLLDWHEAELYRMAKDDYARREACNMAAWIKPKMAHKRFMSKLTQLRAHIILCFRAEPKVEMKKVDGKNKVVPKESLTGLDGWIPICEKNIPFECTASFLLMADHPGILKPIKLEKQHQRLFPLDRPVTRDSGRLIAEWARGAKSPMIIEPRQPEEGVEYITENEALDMETRCKDNGVPIEALKKAAGVDRLALIKKADAERANGWISTAIDRRKERQNA